MSTFQPNPSETRILIGKRIQEIRKKRNLSIRKLALMTGFDNANLGRIEKGLINVKIDKLERIANALGVEIEELFSYERDAK